MGLLVILSVLISLLTACLTTASLGVAICGDIGCGDGDGAVCGCNVGGVDCGNVGVDGGDTGGLLVCCAICRLFSGIVACCVNIEMGLFAVLPVLISLLTACLTTASPIAAICDEIGCGDGGGAVCGCNVDDVDCGNVDVDGGDAGGLFACCVICDVYLLMSEIVAC